MKRTRILSIATALLAVSALPALAAGTPFSWKQTGHSLALVRGEQIVWQHNYHPAEGKPYFHPVTVAGSDTLTGLRPADHVWHRALWFSWKTINGLNYWEEDKTTGKSEGLTETAQAKVTPRVDHSARFEMELSYRPPGETPVLTEQRTLEISAPGAAGAWSIDWTSTFTSAGSDVVLDRTPIEGEVNGAPHGGYAGLSFRLNPALKTWNYTGSGGDVPMQQGRSTTTARWMSFSGALPGGESAAIIVLDHPSNLRHPSAWYLSPGMPFFSPAVLFSSPHTLPAGQSFTLKYRIIFQPGAVDSAAVEEQWTQFAEED